MDSLARCVGQPDRFLAERWDRRAHLHTGGDYADLLGLDAVDEILSSTALRAPAFRVVKGGATLPASSYTRRARIGSRTITDLIDVPAVYRHFEKGATIVLQGVHRYWEPVTAFCSDLELTLTHPVQANAYITPPVAQGLDVHADAHDVFALQTLGEKQWVLYEDRDPDSGPTLDTTLQPGDCLYVPKGTRHAARTEHTPSIHLTLGVRTATWAQLLRDAVESLLEDEAFREALPAGYADDPAVLRSGVADRLATLANALEKHDAAAVADAAARRFWSARRPALRGQLTQLMRLDSVDDDTAVRHRPGTPLRLRIGPDGVRVLLHDRVLRLPSAMEPVLRHVAEHERFVVGDLGDLLDADSRLVLVRRLVREGLLLVDG